MTELLEKMNELLGTLKGTEYQLYKSGKVFKITYPHNCNDELVGRNGYSCHFVYKNADLEENDYKYQKVFIDQWICIQYKIGQIIGIDFPIALGRYVYNALDEHNEEIILREQNYRDFLYADNKNKSDIRKAIIDYINKRYEIIHNKGFFIFEIVSALEFNHKTILSQIDRLIREDALECSFKMHPLNKPFDTLPAEEQIRHRVTKGPKYPLKDLFSPTDIQAHFTRVEVEHKGNYIFLIMPFKETEYPQYIYKDIIKPLCKDVLNCDCIRVDDDKLSIDALNKIYTYTMDCKFLIADITAGNPNVLYELGIAHALKRDVIILFDKSKLKLGEKRPFDLDHIPFTEFTNDDELKKELKLALEANGKKHNLIK